jgi:light-harvesting complex I chlorophyll a/b binding protein 1
MARLSTIVALSLASGAAAFAPATQGIASTSLNALPVEKAIGAQAPVGFFDPLGFVKNGPYGSPEENFDHYRAVEVKHGRIAMAATVGMLTQQTTRFEGFLSPSADLKFSDIPNGLGALKAVPLEGWCQMAVVIGMHEVLIKQREGKVPGDFGTGYFGFSMDDQSSKQISALSAEVSNGRLAMLGILGMFASEIVHNGEVLAETKMFG